LNTTRRSERIFNFFRQLINHVTERYIEFYVHQHSNCSIALLPRNTSRGTSRELPAKFVLEIQRGV